MPDDSSPRSSRVPGRSDDSSSSGSAAGEFSRDMQYITTRITADGADGYRAEPGRYRRATGPSTWQPDGSARR